MIEDHSKRPVQSHLEWLNTMGKHLCILCTESVRALLLCISFKTKDINSYIIFSNPKPQNQKTQLAHSG